MTYSERVAHMLWQQAKNSADYSPEGYAKSYSPTADALDRVRERYEVRMRTDPTFRAEQEQMDEDRERANQENERRLAIIQAEADRRWYEERRRSALLYNRRQRCWEATKRRQPEREKQARYEAIYACRDKGMTRKAIAAHLGISMNQVNNACTSYAREHYAEQVLERQRIAAEAVAVTARTTWVDEATVAADLGFDVNYGHVVSGWQELPSKLAGNLRYFRRSVAAHFVARVQAERSAAAIAVQEERVQTRAHLEQRIAALRQQLRRARQRLREMD
jgi:hypothetical protein